ncbi:serine hydrolase [Rhodococcoides kyotonense]|uniref:Beta-lactamase enzyme family protein n=1 Tax=Rhodococcoides kyotonense TaxID=398843 RepID=A0A239NAW9_9NOCA|nr:serine hydrolase [Rhodococcus kyotonensis]SNT52051.1 Beta-lactamase enzyme family protein [Rhodococcus kyotonensis]
MRRIATASAACATLLVLTGCATGQADQADQPSDCSPATSTDLATDEGWLGLIAQAPDTVGLVIDDGRGRTVEHRAGEEQVLASAMKVVHLSAYAKAVADGDVDPDEQVSLLDWERWYVPGTDGGAHPAALERLGIANDGISATDLDATVRLDDMVTAMIQESDNGVPDYLRYRLGDEALKDAAAAGGWDGFTAPTLVGDSLSLLDPTLAEGDRWETANRWAFDQPFRDSVSASARIPSYDEQVDGVEAAFTRGSAEQLTSLYRSFADGSFGPGADTVLRHLEYQPAPDGALGLGFKGGSLPGILTQAMELRRDDGTVATAVWLVDGMPADRYEAALGAITVQQGLILDAMSSSDALDRIACVV